MGEQKLVTVDKSTGEVVEPAAAPPMSPETLQARRHHVQELYRSIMKPKVHFDIIPGTKKPSLLKAGTEILLSSFRIGIEVFEERVDTGDRSEICYRVKVRGFDIATGHTVGWGVGICTSHEEKYKWRKAVSSQEFDAMAAVDPRLVRWKYYSSGQPAMQVRENPNDKLNTVLKMAKKRAQVDFCHTALACSEIFEIGSFGEAEEEAPPPARGGRQQQQRRQPPREDPPPQRQQTQQGRYPDEEELSDAPPSGGGGDMRKPEGGKAGGFEGFGDLEGKENGKLGFGQLVYLRKQLEEAGGREIDLAIDLGQTSLEAVPAAQFDEALQWIANIANLDDTENTP